MSLLGAVKRFPSPDGARTLCREFPSTPSAVANARRALDGLGAELGEAVHTTAVQLVGELVSNSVKHSTATNGTVELLVCMTASAIRVEVSDDGQGFDPPPLVHDDAEAGRGLHLVQELADRWGCPTGMRTSVWFEIDRVATNGRSRVALAPEVPATQLRDTG